MSSHPHLVHCSDHQIQPRTFVQLNVLKSTGEEHGNENENENAAGYEWREVCRWIKYEQEVEEGAQRWGPPHVSALNFSSLNQLRRLIKKGNFLFDLTLDLDDAEDDHEGMFSWVITKVLEKIKENEKSPGFRQSCDWDSDAVRQIMLAQHKLVPSDSDWWMKDSGKWQSDRNSANNNVINRNNNRKFSLNPLDIFSLSRAASTISVNQSQKSANLKMDGQTEAETAFLSLGPAVTTRRHSTGVKPNNPLLKVTAESGNIHYIDASVLSLKSDYGPHSLPKWAAEGSEGVLVLTAEAPGLELKRPSFSFVRFGQSVLIPEVTEIPIPVRFLIILLGPSDSNFDLKELGRSMGALMSDREFGNRAYITHDKSSLLDGIDAYLEDVVMLPCGNYETDLLLSDNLKEKAELGLTMKKRRELKNNPRLYYYSTEDLLDPSCKACLDLDPELQVPSIKINLNTDGHGLDVRHCPVLGDECPKSTKKSLTNLGLQKTGKYFGGFIKEVKLRYKGYLPDLVDGLGIQCLAAILFISVANISGSIAFGGIMSAKTRVEGNDLPFIGILETLLSSAVGGVLFSLFAGQPLLIIGTTGPMLLFDSSLISLCENIGVDFLAIRTWIGLWLSLISLVFVAFETSSIVIPFLTRFTQETFAALISLVFIAESLLSLVQVYHSNPLASTYGECNLTEVNGTDSFFTVVTGDLDKNQPNTALLCTILMFGTFGVAWTLGVLRRSAYFTEFIRNTIGNFAVPISMLTMLLIEFLVKDSTVTDKLRVPDGFQPTFEGRSWLVDGSSVSLPMAILSVFPALLLFILIFMETIIAELIVAKAENGLVKGGGYHLDILLLALINTLLGFVGLPWVSVALIRAVTHVSSLTLWSSNNAPGEKPTIVGVKEQRLTNLVVSTLAGASLLMAPLLVVMPMAILYGIFLFMGVSSMIGNTFFQRLALMTKQVANHPHVPYVRKVPTAKMHLFTIIQIGWLALLWGIKYTPAALTFPFILILLIPFRFFALPQILHPGELEALDSP